MSLQTVEEAVTCVKCKGLPLSNVYSCDAGHVLCEECNGSTCPKEDCGSEVIFQNQAIQNVINRVFTDYPCSYSYGSTVCLKKGPPVDIRHHQASCLLRPAACIRCHDIQPLDGYYQHMRTMHPETFVEGGGITDNAGIRFNKFCTLRGVPHSKSVTYFRWEEMEFLLRMTWLAGNDVMVWVNLIGNNREAEDPPRFSITKSVSSPEKVEVNLGELAASRIYSSKEIVADTGNFVVVNLREAGGILDDYCNQAYCSRFPFQNRSKGPCSGRRLDLEIVIRPLR